MNMVPVLKKGHVIEIFEFSFYSSNWPTVLFVNLPTQHTLNPHTEVRTMYFIRPFPFFVG